MKVSISYYPICSQIVLRTGTQVFDQVALPSEFALEKGITTIPPSQETVSHWKFCASETFIVNPP